MRKAAIILTAFIIHSVGLHCVDAIKHTEERGACDASSSSSSKLFANDSTASCGEVARGGADVHLSAANGGDIGFNKNAFKSALKQFGSSTTSSLIHNSSDNQQQLSQSEQIITDFLNNEASSGTSSIFDKFHFHGWRWHTLSIIRDTSRLSKYTSNLVAQTTSKKNNHNLLVEQLPVLQKAVHHVINFNLGGLQRIENNVFYPWLKDTLTKQNSYYQEYYLQQEPKDEQTNSNNANTITKAFKDVIDSIELDRKEIQVIANELTSKSQKIITSYQQEQDQRKKNKKQRSDDNNRIISDQQHLYIAGTNQISQLSQLLSTKLQNVFDKEVQYLIPAVATLIPSKEQGRVNNKILRNLGILESRAILVGMYETLHDDKYGNEMEKTLFEREIPFVPRKMIPRWKRTLYEDQAGMLP